MAHATTPGPDSRALSNRLFTVPRLMEETGLGRSTLYREIQAGRLRIVKIGKRTLVTEQDLCAWIELHRSDGCAEDAGT